MLQQVVKTLALNPPEDFVKEFENIENIFNHLSPKTRTEYRKAISAFFIEVTKGKLPTPRLIFRFFQLSPEKASKIVLKYEARLITQGLSKQTINVRLSAIKALVEKGNKLGVVNFKLEEIRASLRSAHAQEKAQQETEKKVQRACKKVSDLSDLRIRSTEPSYESLDSKSFTELLATCDRDTLIGKRNYALLLLLWEGTLRPSEIIQLNFNDFSPEAKTLKLLDKRAGVQHLHTRTVKLSEEATSAVVDWLAASKDTRIPSSDLPDSPLFTALDFHSLGFRLQTDGFRRGVITMAAKAGIKGKVSPDRIRQGAIMTKLGCKV